MFGGLFGKKKTPSELLREYKRTIDKAVREIERERMQLVNAEKKLVADIKRMAREGQEGALRIMAKDLVRTRSYITKFYKMKSQMQAVSLRLQTLKSTQAMTSAMKGCTKAMARMNQTVKLPQIQSIMMEFEKQTEQMDMKEEMIGDTVDEVMEGSEDEEESEAIVSQVLEEIGINAAAQLSSAPDANREAVAEGGEVADKDLEARLERLRNA